MPTILPPLLHMLYNIQTKQRRDYVAASIDGTELVGRMRREEIVDGVRHLAVRWRGHGTATYIQTGPVLQDIKGDTFCDCKLVHWGL